MSDKEEADFADLFGNVVYSYGDAQAVADGVLHNIAFAGIKTADGKPVNRITASIAGMVRVEANGVEVLDVSGIRALAAACDKLEDEWWTGKLDGESLWCIPNEVGGYTLMLPSDY